MIEDFPQPDFPTRATTLFHLISKSIPFKTSTSGLEGYENFTS